jgi:hypothetical protein
MSQMLVIPHRFKKIGVHNLVVRRIFSDILLVLGLKKVKKHWYNIRIAPYGFCVITTFPSEVMSHKGMQQELRLVTL